MTGLDALTATELAELLARLENQPDETFIEDLFAQARALRDEVYGPRVFLRGLIEFTSFCRQNCYYCGLRRGNTGAQRYRLSDEDILACCAAGHALGFRTFVLQGGEDAYFTDEHLCRLVDAIKTAYPDCAVTLSAGERPRESYAALHRAGADRYLLRHETANPAHFALLHPAAQTAHSRQRCLYDLRELGFQTGAGLMVGSPGQTPQHLAQDLLFLKELRPHMVGIGPFLPHGETPFAGRAPGRLDTTLLMLALTRLLLPGALLPATTALGTLHPEGRERGFAAGANVVMPNLSPLEVRSAYHLYNGKLHSGAESASGLAELCQRIETVGLRADFSRGDWQDPAA